ncbi:MAG: hypothetical protein ACREIT_00990 [Tepidisphaeraceae bacterium]
MIVRINQFDVIHADQYSGWPARGRSGPVEFTWPDDAYAFELLILEQDEQHQPLAKSFRQLQLRQLIPEVLGALREPGEEIVVRLDGPLVEGELNSACRHLTDARGAGRFAVSPVQKLDPQPGPHEIESVRIAPAAPERLGALCADLSLGLEKSVRLRAMLVPAELVNPLLDVSEPDDERWGEILARAGCVLGTARGMQSLHLITRRFNPAETKSRLMARLVAGKSAGKASDGN